MFLGIGYFLALANSIQAASDTWNGAISADYGTAENWVGGNVPNGATDVATFQASGTIGAAVSTPGSLVSLDRFVFSSDAPAFGFNLGPAGDLRFFGQGLVNSSTSTQTFTLGSGSAPNTYLRFYNNSNAGNRTLIAVQDQGQVFFYNNSNAGTASFIIGSGGGVFFQNTASGGQASFNTGAGGSVDISGLASTGTTAGSIEGAGNYLLGSKLLTVGYNNRTTEVSGTISGVGGSLRKVGTGALILSGANSYTGNTTLSAGTLIAGHDTAFGVGTLGLNGGTVQASGVRVLGNNVTVGGNFAVGGTAADSLTFGGAVNLGGGTRTVTVNSLGSTEIAGVISNGSLVKAGAGTLTLSGANTYNGNTTVLGGDLRLTGTLNSSVNVAGNAAMSGAGRTTGTLIMNPGAQYRVALTPSVPSGSRIGLAVDGDVVLNNNDVQISATGLTAQYAPSRRYDLLTYGGTATGNFGTIIENFTFLTPLILNEPQNHKFVLAFNRNPLGSVAESSNQRAVAVALDQAWSAESLSETIAPILGMTAEQARDSFSQIGGDSYSLVVRSLFNRVRSFQSALMTRLRDTNGREKFDDSSDADLRVDLHSPRLSFGPLLTPFIAGSRGQTSSRGAFTHDGMIQGFGPPNQPQDSFPLQSGLASSSGFDSRVGGKDTARQQSLWGASNAQQEWIAEDRGIGSLGGRIRTIDTQIGYDRPFGSLKAGFAIGYTESFLHSHKNWADAESRGGMFAAYGRYQGDMNNWYVQGGLGYGIYHNSLNRHLTFLAPTLQTKGTFSANLWHGFMETGFDLYRVNNFSIRPFAGLSFAEAITSTHKEDGDSPFTLIYRGTSYSSTQSTLGLCFCKEGALSGGRLFRAGIEGAWHHEFSSGEIPVHAAFARNPSFHFTSFGTTRAPDTLTLGGEGLVEFGWGFDVFGGANYSRESGQTGVMVMLGLQKKW